MEKNKKKNMSKKIVLHSFRNIAIILSRTKSLCIRYIETVGKIIMILVDSKNVNFLRIKITC